MVVYIKFIMIGLLFEGVMFDWNIGIVYVDRWEYVLQCMLDLGRVFFFFIDICIGVFLNFD